MSSRFHRSLANLLVLIQFSILALLALFAGLYFTKEYWILNLMMTALGFFVLLFAYLSLKPTIKVSPIPRADGTFINTGIYRFIRHPMYLGVILLATGGAGFSENRTALLLVVVLLVNLVIKAKFEDYLLRQKYPEVWEYQREVPSFIPCLGRKGSC